jgi:hypothetical protein
MHDLLVAEGYLHVGATIISNLPKVFSLSTDAQDRFTSHSIFKFGGTSPHFTIHNRIFDSLDRRYRLPDQVLLQKRALPELPISNVSRWNKVRDCNIPREQPCHKLVDIAQI